MPDLVGVFYDNDDGGDQPYKGGKAENFLNNIFKGMFFYQFVNTFEWVFPSDYIIFKCNLSNLSNLTNLQ